MIITRGHKKAEEAKSALIGQYTEDEIRVFKHRSKKLWLVDTSPLMDQQKAEYFMDGGQ